VSVPGCASVDGKFEGVLKAKSLIVGQWGYVTGQISVDTAAARIKIILQKKKPPGNPSGFLRDGGDYLAEVTMARDFSTCSTGEMPSAVEFIEAMILPFLPIT